MIKQSAPSVTVRDQVVTAILGWMEKVYLQMRRFPPNSWEEDGLTSLQLQTIAFLSRGVRAMGEIAAYLDVSPSTATRTIDLLVTWGLVNRLHASYDRRVVRCGLTSKGSQQIQNFWDMSRRRLQEAMQPFSDEELAATSRTMEILAGVLFDGRSSAVEP